MKRFDQASCQFCDSELIETAQGRLVRFEDVAQLERDYEATRAINVRLQGEVDRLTDTLETIESVARGEGGIGNLIARRAAAALRPDTAAPVSAQEGPRAEKVDRHYDDGAGWVHACGDNMSEHTEICEWNPVLHVPAVNPARETDCRNVATVCLGSRATWHLCDSCAKDPVFKHWRRRTPLPPLKTTKPLSGP